MGIAGEVFSIQIIFDIENTFYLYRTRSMLKTPLEGRDRARWWWRWRKRRTRRWRAVACSTTKI